jgi:hypothetical protein
MADMTMSWKDESPIECRGDPQHVVDPCASRGHVLEVGYRCRNCGGFYADGVLHTVLCELADTRVWATLRALLSVAVAHRELHRAASQAAATAGVRDAGEVPAGARPEAPSPGRLQGDQFGDD